MKYSLLVLKVFFFLISVYFLLFLMLIKPHRFAVQCYFVFRELMNSILCCCIFRGFLFMIFAYMFVHKTIHFREIRFCVKCHMRALWAAKEVSTRWNAKIYIYFWTILTWWGYFFGLKVFINFSPEMRPHVH